MSPPRNWSRPAWIRWEEEKLQRHYRALIAEEYALSARHLYTGNASLARDLFLEAGGFDSRFRRAEDVELGYRLADLGARFIFCPRAEVLHYASRSFAAWARMAYEYGRYEVVLDRDRGRSTALPRAVRLLRERHPLNRLLVEACLARPELGSLAAPALGGVAWALASFGASRLAMPALSALFNLLYWQGLRDELGRPVKRAALSGRV
jgi:GT2 family glycosyltransferase